MDFSVRAAWMLLWMWLLEAVEPSPAKTVVQGVKKWHIDILIIFLHYS